MHVVNLLDFGVTPYVISLLPCYSYERVDLVKGLLNMFCLFRGLGQVQSPVLSCSTLQHVL